MMKRPLKTLNKKSQNILGKTAKYGAPIGEGLMLAGAVSGQPELAMIGGVVRGVAKGAKTTNNLLKLTNKK